MPTMFGGSSVRGGLSATFHSLSGTSKHRGYFVLVIPTGFGLSIIILMGKPSLLARSVYSSFRIQKFWSRSMRKKLLSGSPYVAYTRARTATSREVSFGEFPSCRLLIILWWIAPVLSFVD